MSFLRLPQSEKPKLHSVAEGKIGGWPRKEKAVAATVPSPSRPAGRPTDHIQIPTGKHTSSRHSNGKFTGKIQTQLS